MLGKPITVQEWNRSYSTVNGARMVRALLPYHKQALDLGPELPQLNTRMDIALAGIGVAPKRYAKLSLKKFSYRVSSVTEKEKAEIVGEFLKNLESAAKRNVGALCREAKHYPKGCGGEGMGQLYADLMESVGRGVESGLFHGLEKRLGKTIQGGMREDLCGALFNCAHESLWHPIYYQVGFIAAGKLEEAERIGSILKFFQEGNYPCGMMDEKTFLILVA